jgi:hypothetical protein
VQHADLESVCYNGKDSIITPRKSHFDPTILKTWAEVVDRPLQFIIRVVDPGIVLTSSEFISRVIIKNFYKDNNKLYHLSSTGKHKERVGGCGQSQDPLDEV